MLSHSVMVRRSHLLARCYLGTMCMCTTNIQTIHILVRWNPENGEKTHKIFFHFTNSN
jgi:hypothetical protein